MKYLPFVVFAWLFGLLVFSQAADNDDYVADRDYDFGGRAGAGRNRYDSIRRNSISGYRRLRPYYDAEEYYPREIYPLNYRPAKEVSEDKPAKPSTGQLGSGLKNLLGDLTGTLGGLLNTLL